MSNRDSLGFGDLIPHDVVEILAQEKHRNKGRKKRSHSLGRALGWLKGKKRKDLSAQGQSPGLGPALDLALDRHMAAHLGGNRGHKSGKPSQMQGNSHAVLNLHDDDKTPPPPLLQENVFIEASRPKYLEDLHSEALEGLKMMQQEETNTGVEFQDNESTISIMTAQTDGEGGGFTTDSTIPDAASVKSSVSSRSSRSGLTRQGSTFRPLNSGKPSEKGRTRRRHRKTVGGIPQHVQRELRLDRFGQKVASKFEEEEELFNSGPRGSEQKGSSRKDQICATSASHKDDLALLHRLGPGLLARQRPRSVAVPSMTTANSLQPEIPSPVMSMSPQAAYMSKIIPNAVLPPSIEVVEISRGQSRNSLRTVSKSSLLLSSPCPSRSSRRTTSSKSSTITSASHHNPYNLSDTSGWSNSDSSETLVSDSSTISSGNASRKEMLQGNETSSIRKASKIAINGKLRNKEHVDKQDGPFARSLSVIKPKRAPPPPSRSYSLHNKIKRRSRDLAEVVVISKDSCPQSVTPSTGETNEPETSPVRNIDSPGYNGDTSSLDDSTGSVLFNLSKSPQVVDSVKTEKTNSSSQEKQELLQENKISKIISPSSGYSSQDCTSPLLPPFSSSPKHKRGILAKLQRLFPGHSAPSPFTQLETQENPKSSKDAMFQRDKVDSASVSPSVRTLRELFDIPPHPKVHAPPAPPPEVWAHNKRTFELLLGPPAPDNVNAIIKKNPKDRRQYRQSPSVSTSVSTEGSVRSLAGERKQNSPTLEAECGTEHALETQKVQGSALLNVNEVHKISNERLTQIVHVEGNEQVKEKDEKVRVSDILNGMLVKAVEKREERLAAMRCDKGKTTSAQASEIKARMNVVHAVSLIRTSPSPSPPPAHLPPEPPGKQVNSAVSPDSPWPPPPPPMIQVISVPDELDFSLPPPPSVSEGGLIALQPESSARSIPAVTITTELHSSGTAPIVVTTEPEPPVSETLHVVAPPPSLSIPPPPPYAAPLPPVMFSTSSRITEVISSPPKDVASPKPKKGSPPPEEVPVAIVKESAPPLVQVLHPLITKDIPPSSVKATENPSPEVPEAVSAQCSKLVAPEGEIPTSRLYPPQSIPPPPPIEPLKLLSNSSEAETTLQENISSQSHSEQISTNKVLTPPQNVPPPLEVIPASDAATPNTDGIPSNEVLNSLQNKTIIPSTVNISPSPVKREEPTCSPPIDIPEPPPLPIGSLDLGLVHQGSPTSTAHKTPEPSMPVQVEPLPMVTPSLLQMVKLRPVNSSPEPPIAQEPAQAEDHQPDNQVQTLQTNCDTPQKPIRRSLIISSPTSTSTIITCLPDLPQSQSVVVLPAPSSTVFKSPAIVTSPSMNLQEAIRLRTAARSKDSSVPHLSLHSPTSPRDVCQSPTSTASFIFSKNNKRVVIETKTQKDIFSKAVSEAELIKKVKMPPPVAKKPKTKAMDAEGSDAAQPESIMDSAEKTNGAASGTAEGET